jgi:hypothetical protein
MGVWLESWNERGLRRPLEDIEEDIRDTEHDIMVMLREVAG